MYLITIIYVYIGSTARKSQLMNQSRLSGNGRDANGNVLTERVSRISEKINEIHVIYIILYCICICIQTNIEKGKLGKLEEYEKKVNQLEEKFDEAIDTSEKKFEIVDTQVK